MSKQGSVKIVPGADEPDPLGEAYKHEKGDKKMLSKTSARERLDESGSQSDTESSSQSDVGERKQKRKKKSSRDEKRKKDKKKRTKSKRLSEDETSHSGSSEDEDDEGEAGEKRRNRQEERRKERQRRKEEKKKRKEKEKDKKKRRAREEKEREARRAARKAEKEKRQRGPVTEYGKYGLVKESDMWVKRPEFTLWLQEVKKVNLEQLTNSEEKLMFKDYMEDFNTATMPSKKYYNLAHYQAKQAIKAQRKGLSAVLASEMTEFNDEELRRQEVMVERARQKEGEVQRLRAAMQGGMARDMIDQSRLKEEMQYHYRLGNFEEAAKIQKRLDPNVAL